MDGIKFAYKWICVLFVGSISVEIGQDNWERSQERKWRNHVEIVEFPMPESSNVFKHSAPEFLPIIQTLDAREKIRTFKESMRSPPSMVPEWFVFARRADWANFYRALNKDIQSFDVNFKDEEGWTVLHHATISRDPQVIAWLLNFDSIDVNFPTKRHAYTPFLLAAHRADPQTVTQLYLDPRVNIWVTDIDDRDALDITVEEDIPANFDLLLRLGCLRAPSVGRTPTLSVAVAQSRWGMIRPLVAWGADITMPDAQGFPPLNLAPVTGADPAQDWRHYPRTANMRKVRAWLGLLRKRYGDNHSVLQEVNDPRLKRAPMYDPVNLRDVLGDAPIHIATANHAVNLIELLLLNGADREMLSNVGLRPLEIAGLYRRHIEIVKLLAGELKPAKTHPLWQHAEGLYPDH